MLHFIIFKFTLKENWMLARFCLMNLPHSWSSVIYLFICKWLEAGKVRIVCKARDGRLTFISGYLQSCNNTFLYRVYPSRGKTLQCSNLDSPPNRNCGVKKNRPYNKLLHFLLTLQFAASSFPSLGVSLALDVSYISLFFLRGSFRAWGQRVK